MVQPSNKLSALLANLNLTDLNSADLKQLRNVIDSNIVQAEGREMAHARDQINAIAKQIGLPLSEILGTKATMAASTRPALAIKYRNPANKEEGWTGRGRQPKWVKDYVEAGGSLERLEVKA